MVSKCALAGELHKPPSEREGDRDSGGRSPRDFQFARILLLRALLQSPTAPAPSRRAPFVSLPHKNNTAKEKSLVVLVISPLRMQRRAGGFLFLGTLPSTLCTLSRKNIIVTMVLLIFWHIYDIVILYIDFLRS